MRRIVYSTLLFLLLSLSAVAQNGGINFQGMARNAAGEALANQKISLRLSVLLNSESGTVEYSETKEVTTSGQGIFSVVVGDGNILTKTGNFSDINWKNSLKFLKVELDPSGGTNFALMGSSRLQAVPFAYYANGVDAENIQGTLPVAKGGTGVGSIAALKSSLGLDQVNNTADANKPLSTAAQAALETKVDKVTGKGLSANDYTSAEKSKLAAITGTNTGDQDLSGLATTAALAGKANTTDVTTSLATKVDKVTGKELSSNDFTTAEKTKLAAITGTNTGDQDLSGLATTAALAGKANTSDVTNSLATKVDKVTGKELSSNDFTTAEKTKLAAITGTNTGDQDLSGYATTIALAGKANTADLTTGLALKANTTDVTSSLATKVDKVTGKGLSANDFTDAEKSKLTAITGTNTGDQDLSGLATTIALDLKANTTDVTNSLATKVDKVTGKGLSANDYTTAEKTKLAAITGTNTGDQDLSGFATTAALAGKANTTDVTTSLATKVDKVTGKELSSNDYTSAEKTKLAAITGTNTGDQDLSGYATTIALAGKANTTDLTTGLALKANTADVTNSLATKVDKVTGKGLSANDYTSAEKTKLAAITGTNTGDQDLSGLATTIALDLKANTTDVTNSLATKVDKVTGKGLSSNDYTDAEKSKLTAILGTNTGDQDLSGFATNIALDLKANVTDLSAGLSNKVDKILGKGLSSTDFTQEEKDKLTAITGINTGDQDLSGLATTIDLDLKANAVDVTTGLSTKVDKITGKGLSSTDFTQAEKTKLGLITGTNTGDQDLSSLATKAELENDYAKLDEENSFSEDQIFEGRIKFGDDANSNIRVLNYSNEEDEETLEGILISNDEVIFLGKANDDRQQVEGWAFDVEEGTLKFPGNAVVMGQDGNVFYITSENDLFLTSGIGNDEGKWGEIGMSSYERLYLEIFNFQSGQEAGISLIHEDGDEIPMEVKIYNSENSWSFGPSGTLVFPFNSEIGDNDERFFISSDNNIDLYSDEIVYITGEEEVDIDSEGEIDIDSDEEINIDSKSFIKIDSEASSSDDADLSRIRLDYEDGIELFIRNDGDDWEWIFETDGTLVFPNQTKIIDHEDYGFFLTSDNNIYIISGNGPLDDNDDEPNENEDSSLSILSLDRESGISFSFSGEEGEAGISLNQADDGDDFLVEINNSDYEWVFDSDGTLTLPNNSKISDTEEGLEINTEGGIFIYSGSMGNQVDPLFAGLLMYKESGIDFFISGEENGAGISINQANDDNDILVKISNSDYEWKFGAEGFLTFPDGTFFGELEGDNTFGFETEENSDFLLVTSDGVDSFEWQFTNDGVFKLPVPAGAIADASIGIMDNALEIISPNAFILKSVADPDDAISWNFEENGNTTFPADFAVGGALKIGTENIFDKFVTDNFIFNSSQLGIYNVNATYNFTLSTTPRSLSAVAMYFNGSRVNPDRYSLDGRNLTYTKPENESAPTAVTVQFDYIKN